MAFFQKNIIVILTVLFLGTGCSTFNLERKKVEFADPIKSFKFKTVKPVSSEKQGVLLRLKIPLSPLLYSDCYQIYTQISGDEAISIDINKTRKFSYEKVKTKETFYLLTETSTENNAEAGSEKILVNPRGEILEFVKGEFNTKKGKIKFLSHSRSALFPAKPVTIGDKWTYDETMEMKFDSMLLSRSSDEPDKIKVNCRLEGFALVGNHRCAVIAADTFTVRKEKYSTLFKEMKVKVTIFINEKIFFDYKRGIILGVITKTESFSVSEKNDFSDHSRSQAISTLKKPIQKKNE